MDQFSMATEYWNFSTFLERLVSIHSLAFVPLRLLLDLWCRHFGTWCHPDLLHFPSLWQGACCYPNPSSPFSLLTVASQIVVVDTTDKGPTVTPRQRHATLTTKLPLPANHYIMLPHLSASQQLYCTFMLSVTLHPPCSDIPHLLQYTTIIDTTTSITPLATNILTYRALVSQCTTVS